MEASSAAIAGPSKPSGVGVAVRTFFGRYGLIIVLLILPVIYGIHDIRHDHSLARLGENVYDWMSNESIRAHVTLAYTLAYGIIELLNFAHGDVFMLGSFVAVGFYSTLGLTTNAGTAGLATGLLGCLVIAAL